ncbi:hypothetical protein AYO44_16515 [Planctomycetaceae bacterium SCGC AG-212-F19]|nr:hypothetical protein AYO44_16515 [Planctomycetaceae bacterium SCGC AG-212-F19]
MLKRLGSLPRFVLGMATLVPLLAVTAGLWWWLPARPRLQWHTQHGRVLQLQVADDGRTLLTLHENNLSLWDIPSNQERATLRLRGASITSYSLFDLGATLSADGQKVAYHMGKLRLWNPSVILEPFSIEEADSAFDGSPFPLAFTRNSEILITHGSIHPLWDTATGQPRPLPAGVGPSRRVPGGGLNLSFCPPLADGTLVALDQTDGGEYLLWHFQNEARSVRLPEVGHSPVVSRDGRRVASVVDGQVKLLDTTTGREVACFGDKSVGVLACGSRLDGAWAFSPDGRFLLTETQTGTALWDTTTSPPRVVGKFSQDQRVSVVGTGRLLVDRGNETPGGREFGKDGAEWEIWDAATCSFHCDLGPSRITPGVSPDGRTIVCTGEYQPRTSLLAEWLGALVPAFVADAAGPNRPSLVVWDMARGLPMAQLVDGISFSYLPDSQALAVGRDDGTIEIWDIPPRRPWYIDYGLPVLFALLVMLGVRMVWIAVRSPRTPATPAEGPLVA